MLQLKIDSIRWDTPETATFFLSELSGKKIHYKAGQFLTFVFAHHSGEIRRSYSLSSSPDENTLSVTIKRMTNGEISRFMLTKLKPGDVLNAVEPAGKFTIIDPHSEKDVFLFAAGSGITPLFSQLKYLLKRGGQSKVTLVYSNKDDQVLFKTQLDELAALHPDRLKIIYLVSSDGNRLNNDMVERLVRSRVHFGIGQAEFYLCGPFSYMRMVRLTLIYIGVDPGKIRRENFVLETVPVAINIITYPPGRVKIHFNGEVHDIAVGENQSILQAALQNKINLPYSCRVGSCSTCSAICKSGKVAMSVNDVLTDSDLAEGWVLTCTGHPLTNDVEISFGE